MKAGWKTTEFWVTMLAMIGSIATVMQGVLPPSIGAYCLTIAGVAYAVSRGISKAFVIDGTGTSVFPKPADAPTATVMTIAPSADAATADTATTPSVEG